MTEPRVSDTLSVGRVGRPHGLEGAFVVTLPRPGTFKVGIELHVNGVARSVSRLAGTDDHVILELNGVASREDALALRGSDLVLARADAPPLDDGEYWAEDLVGLLVRDGAREFGHVVKMITLPSCEALEVEPGGRLVPMVSNAVRQIDLKTSTVEVDAQFLGWEGPEV